MCGDVERWVQSERGQLLESQSDTAYLLSADTLDVLWVNPAFDRFSLDNGGSTLSGDVLGRSVLDFIPDALTRFYEDMYTRVATTGEPARHDYQCSSREDVRWFSQYILPDRGRVAVVNALLWITSQPVLSCVESWSPFTSEDGIVRQCAHCRRLRNFEVGRWQLHAESYERVGEAPVSHGICGVCFCYFFGDELVSPNASGYAAAPANQAAAFRWLRQLPG